MNISLEQRFHELEAHYAEATTLLHIQGTLILDLQVRYAGQKKHCFIFSISGMFLKKTCTLCMPAQNQLHNLTLLMDKVKRNPGCSTNAGRHNVLMNTQEAQHPGIHSQHLLL